MLSEAWHREWVVVGEAGVESSSSGGRSATACSLFERGVVGGVVVGGVGEELLGCQMHIWPRARLVGDGVVVVVDELVLLDLLGAQIRLRLDGDANLVELLPDHLQRRVGDGVRLDEHKGLHLAVGDLTRHAGDGLRLG